MPCPTCDGTFALLIIADMERCFLCERCGTTIIQRRPSFDKPFAEEPVAVYVPKLVERCREFVRHLKTPSDTLYSPDEERMIAAISEAAYLPAERPEE